MLGHNLLLVLDSLDSTDSKPHTFQQLWHLFPQANLTTSGLTAHVTDAADAPAVEIVPGQTGPPGSMTLQTYYGNTDPLQGWYSEAYGQTEKNRVVGYTEHGAKARYYTLIASGADAAKPASVTATSQSTDADPPVAGMRRRHVRTRDHHQPSGRGHRRRDGHRHPELGVPTWPLTRSNAHPRPLRRADHASPCGAR